MSAEQRRLCRGTPRRVISPEYAQKLLYMAKYIGQVNLNPGVHILYSNDY